MSSLDARPLQRRRFLALLGLAPAVAPALAEAALRPAAMHGLGAAFSPGRLVEMGGLSADLAIDPAAERACLERILADGRKIEQELGLRPLDALPPMPSSIRPAVWGTSTMPAFADGAFLVDDVGSGP